jgi:hypothetical protein
MENPSNSCVHQFTPNMCGSPDGCRGCPSSLEEKLIPSDGQENPAAREWRSYDTISQNV